MIALKRTSLMLIMLDADIEAAGLPAPEQGKQCMLCCLAQRAFPSDCCEGDVNALNLLYSATTSSVGPRATTCP